MPYVKKCFVRKSKLIEIPDFTNSQFNLNIQTISNLKM